jgi:transposase
MNYYINHQEWERILVKLNTIQAIHTKNETALRRFIEGVWFVARSGCQWRLLPERYGSWRAVHMRFKEWSDKGVWKQIFESMHIEADKEVTMIDATIIRAHACSAGYKKDSGDQEALGRSRGGFTTKIHALVDALGNPLKFILTSGQRNDITQAESLLENVANTVVVADKGYDSNALIEAIEKQKSVAVIPSKKNRRVQRAYDTHLYKERHLIECFFGKIKHFRRIFSRFDKTAQVFMGFLNFVGTLIWLR